MNTCMDWMEQLYIVGGYLSSARMIHISCRSLKSEFSCLHLPSSPGWEFIIIALYLIYMWLCGAESSSIRFVIIIFLEMTFHQHLTELLSKSLLALLIIIIQWDCYCSPSPNIVHIITMIIIISILLLL